jgi:hypothetical protein
MTIERLTPKISEKWDRKLENWALWYFGGKRIVAEPSAYDALKRQDTGRDQPAEQTFAAVWETEEPPALVGDATDTHALIALLPERWFEAVRTWYCLSGPIDMRAADLGVHSNTLRARVNAAKVELERMDGQRRRGERPTAPTGGVNVLIAI